MQVKLIGFQEISFVNNNGENINGINIYIAFADSNVNGLKTEKLFLREGGVMLPKGTKLNDTLNLSFNIKGKVESITKTQE